MRVEFHTTDQTFVTITESSAHTDFLAIAAHRSLLNVYWPSILEGTKEKVLHSASGKLGCLC